MIRLEQVSKYFGNTKAVDRVSFEVADGETLVLLGTSGCGKTTTLRMINRLTEPSDGTISLNGKNVAEQSPEKLRRGIGYVLQNNGLFPHYTVAENIAVVPNLLKWDKQRIRSRSAELLEKLHLSENYLPVYPDKLSGGQQQRVGLARALMADPPVLLMDEPFGALDPITRGKIRKEFAELDEFKKKTIIMVTHDVQEAFELADRLCLMDKGKIMQTGTPADLLFNPQNDFAKSFFNEQRLQLEFRAVKLADIWNDLPAENIEPITGQEPLTTDISLWEALSRFRQAENTGIQKLVVKNTSGQVKTAAFSDLIIAFSRQKSVLHE